MSAMNIEFRSNAVEPIQCIKQGWQLLKGQYWLFLGITLVAMLVGSVVPFGILLGPMFCGLYLCLLDRAGGNRVRFEMLFRGFDYFRASLAPTLLQVIPSIFILVPINIALTARMAAVNVRMQQHPPQDMSELMPLMQELLTVTVVTFGVAMIIGVILGVFFMFTYPLIVERKMPGMEALKLSMRAGSENLFGLAGLLILNIVISLLGASCCYVGAILYLPISFASLAVAYQQVFPRKVSFEGY
jgi:uncharacterized membrane protein